MSRTEELYLYLVTTGRSSGKPHEIEIWFVEIRGTFYLIAEKEDRADWVRNIRVEPRITFRVGEEAYQGRARILDAGEDVALVEGVRALFEDKYGWNTGLVVELTPHRR